jgi:hypothetical protein
MAVAIHISKNEDSERISNIVDNCSINVGSRIEHPHIFASDTVWAAEWNGQDNSTPIPQSRTGMIYATKFHLR